MSRTVAEWRGKTDDSPVPPRVRLRIYELFDGRCCCGCNRKILVGEKWDVDHEIALINGGEHREGNLRPVLSEHHKTKTRADLALKSHSYKRRASHAGIKRKRSSFATNRDQPWKKKLDGTLLPRERRR